MKLRKSLLFISVVCSFLCSIFLLQPHAVFASISTGDFTWQEAKNTIKNAGYESYASGIKNVDTAVCALLKKASNNFTGVPLIKLSDNKLEFNDNENLVDTKLYKTITASGITKQCSMSGSTISVGSVGNYGQGEIDNVFFGYSTNDIDIKFNIPSVFYNIYYKDKTYGGKPACSDDNHGELTRGDIKRSSGKGCNAYSFIGENKHSLTTNSTSINLKINPARFIGEDGHDTTSSTCSGGTYSDCYSRKVFAYFCPSSSEEFVKDYPLNKYACRFQSFSDFKLYVKHTGFTATNTATPASSKITSSTGSQTISFTSGYSLASGANDLGITPTVKVERKIGSSSYIDVTESCNSSCTVKVTAGTAGAGEIHVDNNSSVKICQKTTVSWDWNTYSKKSNKAIGVDKKTTTKTANKEDCATVSRTDPEEITGGANFETESNNADDKSWDDGKEHTETITINHLINRTDSNANPASVKTKYIVYESKNGRNGTYTQLSPKKDSADSQSFTQNNKSQSLSVKSSDIKVSAGQTIEYCQKIVVISSADVNGNLGSSWTSGTIGCANLSVGTPAEETVNFTPSVSGTSLDANLTPGGSDGDTLKFVGDGETTTYYVTFSASIKRENNSSSKVTSASANYNTYCLKSKKLEKCNSSVSLKNNEAQYIGGWNNGTFTVSVPVGKTVKQCLSLTASTSVKYKVYSSGQIDEIAGSRTEDTVTDCVEISNPIPRQTITFGGSSTATNLDSVSYWAEQNMWVGEFNEYYPNLKHTISRTSAESSLKQGIKDAPIRYKISATLNGTAQSSVNITSSSTLNYNDTKTVRDTLAKVPVTRGYSSNYCEKLEHDSEVYWEGGKFEQRSPGYDESHEACIKYGTPAYSEESESEYKYFSITGTVSAPNNTDEAIKVDDYYLLKANKTSLTFPHKLERSDNGTEGSTANGTYNVQHKIGASGNFTNIITNSAFRLTSGPNNQDNYYKNFNATSTDISPSGLGTENAKQVCQKNTFVSKNYTVTITNTFDVGKIDGIEYSRRQKSSTIGDTADGDGTTGESNTVCVNVVRPYNFHIIREGTNSDAYLHRTNPENVVYSGQTYTVKYQATIKKEKDEYSLTGIPNANIRLLAFVFDADAPDITEAEIFPSLIDGVKESNSPSPETYYTNILDTNGYDGKYKIIPVNGDDGENKAIENGGIVPGDGRPYTYTYSYESTIKDLSPGQKYCTALAISPADSGITGLNSNSFTYGWVVSNLSCSNVAKKPTMQVHGGSVYARKINTSKSSLPTSDGNERNYFGSWGDFALISTGDPKNSGILAGNAGMASGAALANGKKNASTICTHSPLTITNEQCKNSGDNNSLGGANVSIANSPEDFYNAFKQLFIGKDSTLNGSSGDVRINENDGGQFTFDDGKTIIYYSDTNKTITIKNNLEVDDDYGSISELPQIIILSGGNVNIDESVERVDAWIIAKGTVNTCSGFDPAGDKKPSSDDCDSQLVINGPVISNSLILPRTAGADPSEGEKDMSTPAELIDYLPSSLLWAYNQAKNGNTPQTVYLKELAPRR